MVCLKIALYLCHNLTNPVIRGKETVKQKYKPRYTIVLTKDSGHREAELNMTGTTS